MSTTEKPDIWHDDEGVWRQMDHRTYGPFETEEQAEQLRDTAGEHRGYDADGHKVVVGWVSPDGSEYLIGLTLCCEASAKGSEAGTYGIVCRRCYSDCDPLLGGEATLAYDTDRKPLKEGYPPCPTW